MPISGLLNLYLSSLCIASQVSAARAVETIAVDAHNAGKRLYACGIRDGVAQVLQGLGVADHLPANMQFETRLEALEAAKEWILEDDELNGSGAEAA